MIGKALLVVVAGNVALRAVDDDHDESFPNAPAYSCAANAAIDADGQGNRAFNKKRSRGRIDGMVTTTMAVGAALASVKPKRKSVYASRGIVRV